MWTVADPQWYFALRMTAAEIRKYQQREPFHPFSLVLSTGTELPVQHPEMIWIPRGDRLVMVSTSEDDYEVVDLIHVVSLKVAQDVAR
jgi:hypothetical protein